MTYTSGDGISRDISEMPKHNAIVTIYYDASEVANLPTDAAVGSVAINPSTVEVKMFNGTIWVTWKDGE